MAASIHWGVACKTDHSLSLSLSLYIDIYIYIMLYILYFIVYIDTYFIIYIYIEVYQFEVCLEYLELWGLLVPGLP